MSTDTGDSAINTAPPAEPEEDVTEVPDSAVDLPAAEPTDPPLPGNVPAAVDCSPAHPVYIPTKQGDKYHFAVGPANSNYNGTSRTAKSTFTSEVTGEVGVAVSGDLETSINTMIAKIKAKFNVTVSAKITAKIGNSISVDTPPHKTTHAKYGVWRLKHTGKSYYLHQNCTTSPEHTVVSYSPFRLGWYLWES